jgi:hypothetical protein
MLTNPGLLVSKRRKKFIGLLHVTKKEWKFWHQYGFKNVETKQIYRWVHPTWRRGTRLQFHPKETRTKGKTKTLVFLLV